MKINKEKFNNTMTQLMVFVVCVVIFATFMYFKKDRWEYYDYPNYSVEFPIPPTAQEKVFVIEGHQVPVKKVSCTYFTKSYAVYTLKYNDVLLNKMSFEQIIDSGLDIAKSYPKYKITRKEYKLYNNYPAYTVGIESNHWKRENRIFYTARLFMVDDMLYIIKISLDVLKHYSFDKDFKRFVDSFEINPV